MTINSEFLPGSLVRARNRDWIALPAIEENVLRLRPVDGSESDAIGIYLPLEPDAAKPAKYKQPDPRKAGGFESAALLRDAARLRLRSGAGPFRSMGRVSVIPRPYQFVPLIMALRQNPIRLLIADDVGVGKTIEAAMIAREALDRGIARRIGVLCAPHLCGQWADELETKFGLNAQVLQSSTVRRLERELPRADVSIYRHFRHLVMSVDFVKQHRHKAAFLADAPDFIIVDEAHTAARPGGKSNEAHRRYELLRDIAKDTSRHLVLATATPHSGVEDSFRSLLGLLDDSLDVPVEEKLPREKMVPLFVQRRRSDIAEWMDEETPFPKRESSERTYTMSAAYLKLYDDVLGYCRETVSDDGGGAWRQRVRYWAALSILRCVLSSPSAARAVLENRKKRTAAAEETMDVSERKEKEKLFRSIALDESDSENPPDYAPAAALDDSDAALAPSDVRKLDGFLKSASRLEGPDRDAKIAAAASAASDLLVEGYSPIVYCRFIQTAYYAETHLREILQKEFPTVEVRAVTGAEGDSEKRAEIVQDLAKEPLRVLVATDCLSEGVNLQESYDAVVHYDLPWNPNRLEQREGRVDRFGQKKPLVKIVLLYGADNHMDLTILDVLIRKASAIREVLGTSVPAPSDSEKVLDALIESVLQDKRSPRRGRGRTGMQLGLLNEDVSRFHQEWEKRAEAEKRTRTYFAQRSISPNEVARELREMEPALGSAKDIQRFVAAAAQRFHGELRKDRGGSFLLSPGEAVESMALDRMNGGGASFPMRVSFSAVPKENATTLGRSHPVVEAMSEMTLSLALSEGANNSFFARSGAVVTDAVSARTAVLILRLRYLIKSESDQFAEEIVCAAFRRGLNGGGLDWLEPLDTEALRLMRDAAPAANMSSSERCEHVQWALNSLERENGWHKAIVSERAGALADAHSRLRKAAKSARTRITPHVPPDVIGAYALVPSGAA